MSHYPTSQELAAHRLALRHRALAARVLDPCNERGHDALAPDIDFIDDWLAYGAENRGAIGSEDSIGIGYRDMPGATLYMPVLEGLHLEPRTSCTYLDAHGHPWAGAWAGAWWAALLRGYPAALRPAGLLLRRHLIEPPASKPTSALERAYGLPLGWTQLCPPLGWPSKARG